MYFNIVARVKDSEKLCGLLWLVSYDSH